MLALVMLMRHVRKDKKIEDLLESGLMRPHEAQSFKVATNV